MFQSASCSCGHAELGRAELVAQHEVVEDEADLERAEQLRFDLRERFVVEALRFERRAVDVRRALERVRALGERLDRRDLLVAVAETAQRRFDRLVDDLEVAAAGELLELHEREVGLDAGRIAIHHEADRAGRRDDGDLRVAVTRDLADRERVVPHDARQGPRLLREERRRMRYRGDA